MRAPATTRTICSIPSPSMRNPLGETTATVAKATVGVSTGTKAIGSRFASGSRRHIVNLHVLTPITFEHSLSRTPDAAARVTQSMIRARSSSGYLRRLSGRSFATSVRISFPSSRIVMRRRHHSRDDESRRVAARLRRIVGPLLSRRVARHYGGFATSQLKLFDEKPTSSVRCTCCGQPRPGAGSSRGAIS